MRSVSGLIFKQPKRELVAAGEWDWAGTGGGTKGGRKRKQVLEKGKGRGGSEPERARGAFEEHAKRTLRGCFSDFGGKSVSTDYKFALETSQGLLKNAHKGKR